MLWILLGASVREFLLNLTRAYKANGANNDLKKATEKVMLKFMEIVYELDGVKPNVKNMN